MDSTQTAFIKAQAFGVANLTQCCVDLAQFYQTGEFPQTGHMHELVQLCSYAGERAQSLATYIVNRLAVTQVGMAGQPIAAEEDFPLPDYELAVYHRRKDEHGNFQTGDERLDLLLGLTEDICEGRGNMDTALLWMSTLEGLVVKLQSPEAKPAAAG